MEDSKHVSTPMMISFKLSKENNSPPIDQTLCRSMIGGLLYLNSFRPNILKAVCMIVRFQVAPK